MGHMREVDSQRRRQTSWNLHMLGVSNAINRSKIHEIHEEGTRRIGWKNKQT